MKWIRINENKSSRKGYTWVKMSDDGDKVCEKDFNSVEQAVKDMSLESEKLRHELGRRARVDFLSNTYAQVRDGRTVIDLKVIESKDAYMY